MRNAKIGFVIILGLALAVAGCGKKSMDQANLSGTGTDTLDRTEELAQLPQASTSNQQSAVEVLPIETSPVTQGVPATPLPGASATTMTAASTATSTGTLSHNQEIQTALKNAGLYNGKIDGKIGPASRKAIETFQQNNGLKADGKVGPKTWALLEPYLSGNASSASTAAASSETSGN